MDLELYEEHETFYLLKAPQRSKAWFEGRNRVTASNFATARGLNPFEEVEDYVNQLKGRKKKKTLTDIEQARIQHGIDTEPIAKAYYEKQTGRVVTEVSLIISKEYPKLGGSPDGVVIGHCDRKDVNVDGNGEKKEEMTIEKKEEKNGKWERLIEIKCPRVYPTYYPRHPPEGSWTWIPIYYYDQIQGYMLLSGVPVCDFVVYAEDHQIIHPVSYNEPYVKKMLKDLLAFIEEYDI